MLAILEYAYILFLMRFGNETFDEQAGNTLLASHRVGGDITKVAGCETENNESVRLRRKPAEEALQPTFQKKLQKIDLCALAIMPITFVLLSTIYWVCLYG